VEETGEIIGYVMIMIVWWLDLQSLPITTNVVSLNSAHGEVYSIQHYVIKFVSDLGQFVGFLWVLHERNSISQR
jgi:hypothetical protein